MVAIPAAETTDDPGSPSQAVRRMRVPEPFAPGFEPLIEGSKCGDLACVEGNMGGLLATVARLQQLDGDDGGFGGDGDQLEEPLGGADLAVFEPEAVCLEDAEELLDDPALFIPFDDLPGVLRIGDPMSGEKPPMQRLDASRRIDFVLVFETSILLNCASV